MNGEHDNGGPAFPQNEFSAFTTDREGMSLRDWFAGQAVAGILMRGPDSAAEAAWAAYQVADAMIAERKGGDA